MSKHGVRASSVQISPIGLQPIGADRSDEPDADLRSRLASSLTWTNLRTLLYFVVWFTLSVVYNLCNKKVDGALGMSVFLATIQMWTGVPIITFLWLTGLRPPPSITSTRLALVLALLAMFHAATHLGGVVSMGGEGAVYLTQVIKATEPVFTALLSVLILGQVYAWQVYLSLFGVCAGCVIVSIAQARFQFLPLVFAVISALAAALRGTVSKETLKPVPGQYNLKAQDLYYVLTMIGAVYCSVFAVAIDGHRVVDNLNSAITSHGHVFVWGNIIGSGLAYYLYNEVAFLALDSVSPVTHAIGSTSKRIFIIAASLMVFQNDVDAWGYTGMSITIVCVAIYSLAKIRFPGRSIRKPFSSTTAKC